MSAENGLWAVFGALGTVQVMDAAMCGREVAAMAFQQVSQKYVGGELTTDQLTDIVLEAIEVARKNNPFLVSES